MNPLMDALQRAKGAKWHANASDAPPDKPDSSETPFSKTPHRERPPPPDHQSVTDWSLAPITPSPMPREIQSDAQKPSSIVESEQIGNPSEPTPPELTLEANLPGQKTPTTRKTMANRGFREILLFGVLPLLLLSIATGAYVYRKVMIHETSYAPEKLPSFPIESVMPKYASAQLEKTGTDFMDQRLKPGETRHSTSHLSGPTVAHPLEQPPAVSPPPEKSARSDNKRTLLSAESPRTRAIPIEIPKDSPPQKEVNAKPSPPDRIKITRTRVPDPLHATLVTGFNAFKNGDNAAATTAYRDVLKQQPDNRDALLGLAAVAIQKQQWETAANHYFQILRNNPRDAAAQAALLDMRNNLDPKVGEDKIKLLLKKEPNMPYLHFALGNFYARQSRWFQAEQAYFNAYQADNTNVDYSYNLAVSLDHLAKRKAALTYYRRALELVTEQPQSPGFDPAIVRQRIEAIETNLE
uniref:TPR repeat-containing protein n=1 Tax=Candidatus Kentrum sp. TUN TaxID=2126343 RepID=A0A450ZWG6_9GAMM|nr:MAG: TPR repeat-containing protein [Candidatus Kentron sp. TUN]